MIFKCTETKYEYERWAKSPALNIGFSRKGGTGSARLA